MLAFIGLPLRRRHLGEGGQGVQRPDRLGQGDGPVVDDVDELTGRVRTLSDVFTQRGVAAVVEVAAVDLAVAPAPVFVVAA